MSVVRNSKRNRGPGQGLTISVTFVKIVLILGLLVGVPTRSVLGDELQSATPESTFVPDSADSGVIPEGAEPIADVPDDPEPVTVEPTGAAEGVDATIEPTSEDLPTVVPATSTPEPTAVFASVLRYSPAQQPVCTTVDLVPDVISSGGSLDYECRYDLQVSTEKLYPSRIVLDWTISAVAAGWTVQLKPQATVNVPDPQWSSVAVAPAEITVQSTLEVSGGSDVADFTQRLHFTVRVTRPTCAFDPVAVVIASDVVASVPGSAQTTIERIDLPDPEEPFHLSPTLEGIIEPQLAFRGGLDFGIVPVDARGVQEQPAPQTLTVVVSNLATSCGQWKLQLEATSLGAEDGSTVSNDGLVLVSVNGVPLPGGGCSLFDGCSVAVIEAATHDSDSVEFDLGIALVLPEQLGATTFDSTLIATMTRVTA